MAGRRLTAGAVSVAALLLPLAAATGFIAWVAAGERAGIDPLAAPPYRNSAEAAASGDAAAMLRLIRMGDNPTRIHPICCELISSQVQYATTLEAALWSRRIEMIRALDRLGAIVDADQRRELACLALDLDMPDVSNYLAPGDPCVRGAAMDRIIARTREAGGLNE